mgnify:CR=1 FL=1
MNMKLKKKIMASVFSLAVVGTVFSGSLVKAAKNNNIGYSFYIGAYERESYCSDVRTRSTSNPKNCWKVNLAYSGEGKGKVTRFWLAKGTSVVSDSVNAKQGGAVRYKYAFSSANKSNVRLRACNNNYSASGYTVSGYWDEETGVLTEK